MLCAFLFRFTHSIWIVIKNKRKEKKHINVLKRTNNMRATKRLWRYVLCFKFNSLHVCVWWWWSRSQIFLRRYQSDYSGIETVPSIGVFINSHTIESVLLFSHHLTQSMRERFTIVIVQNITYFVVVVVVQIHIHTIHTFKLTSSKYIDAAAIQCQCIIHFAHFVICTWDAHCKYDSRPDETYIKSTMHHSFIWIKVKSFWLKRRNKTKKETKIV